MSRQKLGHAIWQNNGKLDQTLFSISIGNALNVLSNLSMFVQYLNLYELGITKLGIHVSLIGISYCVKIEE